MLSFTDETFAEACETFQPDGTSLREWDVSAVTCFTPFRQVAVQVSAEFWACPEQDITGWDVSRATDLSFMFAGSAFDQPIGRWNLERAVDLSGMFARTTRFNQFVGYWNLRSVQRMTQMFGHSTRFAQPLHTWLATLPAALHDMPAFIVFNHSWLMFDCCTFRSTATATRLQSNLRDFLTETSTRYFRTRLSAIPSATTTAADRKYRVSLQKFILHCRRARRRRLLSQSK